AERLRRKRVRWPGGLCIGRNGVYPKKLCRRTSTFSPFGCEIEGRGGRAFGALFRSALSRSARSQGRSLRYLSTSCGSQKSESVSRRRAGDGCSHRARARTKSGRAKAVRGAFE